MKLQFIFWGEWRGFKFEWLKPDDPYYPIYIFWFNFLFWEIRLMTNSEQLTKRHKEFSESTNKSDRE